MSTIRSQAAALACIALLAIAVTACGDSDEGGESGGTSRADYIATVDEICATSTAEVDAETQERLGGESAPSAQDLQAFVVEVSLPALREQYEEIAALEPPAGDEEEVQEILDAAETAIAAVEDDPSSILVIVGKPTPFDEVSALLQDYGIRECGGTAAT